MHREGEEGGNDVRPPGQFKRLVVLVIRSLGEDADDDVEFEIMTYLPFPDEEKQQLGAGMMGAAGAPGALGEGERDGRADGGGGGGGGGAGGGGGGGALTGDRR